MTAHELISTYLLPVLGALALYLVRRATAALEARAAASGHDANLAALERVAEAAVAVVEQTVVRDAKDPGKPGAWDAFAMKAAKDSAVALVKSLAPALLKQLKEPGSDADTLLGAMIERAVITVRGRGALAKVAASIPPPAAPSVPPPAKPPSLAPTGPASDPSITPAQPTSAPPADPRTVVPPPASDVP